MMSAKEQRAEDDRILDIKLKPGVTFKDIGMRLAGHWMVWKEPTAAALNESASLVYRCERIKAKRVDRVIGERGTRKHLSDVWLLACDYDPTPFWPQYEWGAFQGLDEEACRQVLLQAIRAREDAAE